MAYSEQTLSSDDPPLGLYAMKGRGASESFTASPGAVAPSDPVRQRPGFVNGVQSVVAQDRGEPVYSRAQLDAQDRMASRPMFGREQPIERQVAPNTYIATDRHGAKMSVAIPSFEETFGPSQPTWKDVLGKSVGRGLSATLMGVIGGFGNRNLEGGFGAGYANAALQALKAAHQQESDTAQQQSAMARTLAQDPIARQAYADAVIRKSQNPLDDWQKTVAESWDSAVLRSSQRVVNPLEMARYLLSAQGEERRAQKMSHDISVSDAEKAGRAASEIDAADQVHDAVRQMRTLAKEITGPAYVAGAKAWAQGRMGKNATLAKIDTLFNMTAGNIRRMSGGKGAESDRDLSRLETAKYNMINGSPVEREEAAWQFEEITTRWARDAIKRNTPILKATGSMNLLNSPLESPPSAIPVAPMMSLTPEQLRRAIELKRQQGLPR